MTVILTIGKESLLLKHPVISNLTGMLEGAQSVSKDYSGKWDINPRAHLPIIEFTVLPYDVGEEEKPEEAKEE